MTLQQTSDRAFAKMLANSCFKMGIDKLPFSLSSQQYQYFLQEWKNLQKTRNRNMIFVIFIILIAVCGGLIVVETLCGPEKDKVKNISELKYKVGDRVRIKNFDWFRNEGAHNMVVAYMKEYYGEVVTIKSVHKDFYRIKEDDWQYCWTDEMIEGLVEEETKPKMVNLDDVCEWVEKHIFDFPWYDNEQGDFSSKDVANALRKAMEE